MMKSAVFFTTMVMLSGCVALPANYQLAQQPSLDEFPDHEVVYVLNGKVDDLLQDIRELLSKQMLPSTVAIESPKTFILTTYIEEPKELKVQRVRRTAFRFALTEGVPSEKKNCSVVSVVSITKSRGMREEIWSIQSADLNFKSAQLPELKSFFEKRACK